MFNKIKHTAFPPTEKPMMVWDGECGFCKYWIINWNSKTGNRIEYRTYQEVASRFQDIPLKEFKKASRLIETNGKIYSGPDSAFRSFTYFTKERLAWHRWYTEYAWFEKLCDQGYNFIAKNRPFMFAATKIFFGKNSERIKHYWLILLLIIVTGTFLLFKFL